MVDMKQIVHKLAEDLPLDALATNDVDAAVFLLEQGVPDDLQMMFVQYVAGVENRGRSRWPGDEGELSEEGWLNGRIMERITNDDVLQWVWDTFPERRSFLFNDKSKNPWRSMRFQAYAKEHHTAPDYCSMDEFDLESFSRKRSIKQLVASQYGNPFPCHPDISAQIVRIVSKNGNGAGKGRGDGWQDDYTVDFSNLMFYLTVQDAVENQHMWQRDWFGNKEFAYNEFLPWLSLMRNTDNVPKHVSAMVNAPSLGHAWNLFLDYHHEMKFTTDEAAFDAWLNLLHKAEHYRSPLLDGLIINEHLGYKVLDYSQKPFEAISHIPLWAQRALLQHVPEKLTEILGYQNPPDDRADPNDMYWKWDALFEWGCVPQAFIEACDATALRFFVEASDHLKANWPKPRPGQ